VVPLVFAAAVAVSLQLALERRVSGVPGTGIAVGIIDHGVRKIYVAGSDGHGRPVDQHTLFEIGSVTKTFTATTLAEMALSHSVRLNDPIDKYLPDGIRAPTKDGRPITLLNLAEQRSGLPRLPSNIDAADLDDPYSNYTVGDMYAFLKSYQVSRDPGAAYAYSNYGIGLLGQLLANRAGMAYCGLVRKTVLDPLGMNATAFAVPSVPDPTLLAVGHDLGGTEVPTWHFQSILPAGGIVSNLDDMLKYLRCNMGEGPLARACLFAQQPRAAGEPRHQIGLVWNVSSATGVISHGGDTFGFHAYVAMARDRQSGVVVLSNGPAVSDIAANVLAPDYPIAACPSSVPASKTDPASYVGVYCNQSGGVTFTVETATSDALSIALVPQPALLYKRTDADTYYAASVEATFKFSRADEKIVGLRLTQYGRTVPAVRLDERGNPVVAQLSSPSPSASSPAIQLARSRIDMMLRTGHADPSWFSASFLAQIPASRVDEVIASITKTLGAYQSVEFTPEKFIAHFEKRAADVFIHLDADLKIDELVFKSAS
jgi:D-alanyl-D-alanine-carboxypeptidase/D-alanyl-D-alanine-endopeptidase